MRLLITTPTGQIGRRIVSNLIDSNNDLVLLARAPEKLSDTVRAGSTIITGSLESDADLDRALAGVDAAFFLIPPPPPDVPVWRAWSESVGARFVSAATRAGVERVVFLSSIGAQHDDLGAISALGAVEGMLRQQLPDVVAIRAGYFMENYFGSVPTIASHQTVYGVPRADIPQFLVATQDIGDIATRWLTDGSWTGHHVIAAHGPAPVSQHDVAATLTDVLGRPVQYVQIPPAGLRDALLEAGFPSLIAHGYETMMGGMSAHLEAGTFSAEPHGLGGAGTVAFREFAERALKPALS
jgi:uncharacterized protein YbjT (DUF2867 family)